MKHRCLAALVLLSIFIFCLSGCAPAQSAPQSEPETQQENPPELSPARQGTPEEIAATITHEQQEIPPLQLLRYGEEEFTFYLTTYYGIEEAALTGGVICYAGGIEASEIAVLTLAEDADQQAIEDAFSAYIDMRVNDFIGYVPEQADMVEKSRVVFHEQYVALLACPDPQGAEESFDACFEAGWTPPESAEVFENLSAVTPLNEAEDEEASAAENGETTGQSEPVAAAPSAPSQNTSSVPVAPPVVSTPSTTTQTPVTVTDNYDRSAVVRAWQNQDPSGLSPKNRAVYDAAAQVISQRITSSMSDYDKELALHDWMTQWGQYDPEAHSHAPDASPNPDNDNPYGFLVGKVGICRGYSSTFQLLMDLVGVECITVSGSSRQEEHAWNMVRLDGEWYCVDVTWDDPSGGSPGHRYFNVTSDYMRQTNHTWDESDAPVATATAYAWGR